jgi:predicted phage tail protein
MKTLVFLFALILAQVAYSDTLTFTWVAPPVSEQAPVDGYKLYISKVAGEYSITPKATVTGTSAIVSETAIGKYFAVVTAYNTAGESGRSNEVTFEVKARAPGAPTGLTFIQRLIAFIKSFFNFA